MIFLVLLNSLAWGLGGVGKALEMPHPEHRSPVLSGLAASTYHLRDCSARGPGETAPPPLPQPPEVRVNQGVSYHSHTSFLKPAIQHLSKPEKPGLLRGKFLLGPHPA